MTADKRGARVGGYVSVWVCDMYVNEYLSMQEYAFMHIRRASPPLQPSAIVPAAPGWPYV